MEISVVIPAYNEENVIANTIADVKAYLASNFSSYEIIVVNDKSSDGTYDIINNISDVRTFNNLRNHGKGYSVKKGVKHAQGDWILFMDADNSTSIKELDNFMNYKDNYDLIIASRGLDDSKITISQSYFKVLLGKFGNLFSRAMIDSEIKDTQCGFKLFRHEIKNIFAKLTIDGFAFDFELIFLARKFNYKIKELPVTWTNNFESSVKWYSYPQSLWQLLEIRTNNLIGKYN